MCRCGASHWRGRPRPRAAGSPALHGLSPHTSSPLTPPNVQVRGITLEGSPQTESSWFPGFAWTVAYCRACWHHLGWRFTAVQPGLRPASFWGLRRSAIQVRTLHAQRNLRACVRATAAWLRACVRAMAAWRRACVRAAAAPAADEHTHAARSLARATSHKNAQRGSLLHMRRAAKGCKVEMLNALCLPESQRGWLG